MPASRDWVQGSRIVPWMRRCIAGGRMLLARCGAWVTRRAVWRDARRTWRATPLRAIGWMLIAGVATNGLCLWRLGRTINGFGIAYRLLLLALGVLAAVPTADWQAVKQGSRLMRDDAA